ncbi:MAG: hypothetical protein LC667_07310 [Thioalkalivibrio sp.]|nr:hypothetical protein [Thioalkalivibrio sp.]
MSNQVKDMIEHARFTVDAGVHVSFRDSNSPMQRISDEYTNGLPRHCLPRGADFDAAHEAKLDQVADSLIEHPRDALDWQSLDEANAATGAVTREGYPGRRRVRIDSIR